MANAADDYALTSPAMRSNYQPEWAQDPTNTVVPPSSVKEHGSPEDHKDMIRMGRAQEMRVSLDRPFQNQLEMLINVARECSDSSR
jgi:hypothetical protein